MKLLKLALVAAAFVAFVNACNKTSSRTTGSRPLTAKPGPAFATQTPTPDKFAAARGAFAKNCVPCHGEDAEGGTVKLEDGTKLKVPSLRRGRALRDSDAALVRQITKGGEGMPAFKHKLKPEEINDLVRFIRHELQGGQK